MGEGYGEKARQQKNMAVGFFWTSPASGMLWREKDPANEAAWKAYDRSGSCAIFSPLIEGISIRWFLFPVEWQHISTSSKMALPMFCWATLPQSLQVYNSALIS
jgi:hypothetical protein